jgi:hypothetical protein
MTQQTLPEFGGSDRVAGQDVKRAVDWGVARGWVER